MKDENIAFIELLKHKDVNKFKEFIRDQWSQTHIFAYDTSILDWQHKGKDFYHCMAAFRGEELIGVHGIIPLSHFDSCLPKQQIFLSLWKAVEDKEIGVGLRLYKRILKEYNPTFIGGLGINSRVLEVFKWLGFTTGTMDHHVILSPYVDEFRVACVPNKKNVLKYVKVTENKNYSFVKCNKKKLRSFDTSLIYSCQIPMKSDTYVVNRYLEHPVYRYDVYALMKNNIVEALCVIRPIKIDDTLVLRFVDYIGQNDSFLKLFNHLLEVIKLYKAEYIDIYSYGIPLEILTNSGFINRKKLINLVIPNHFEPFERRNIEVNFAFRDLKEGKSVRLFKADSDTDRPSMILEHKK